MGKKIEHSFVVSRWRVALVVVFLGASLWILISSILFGPSRFGLGPMLTWGAKENSRFAVRTALRLGVYPDYRPRGLLSNTDSITALSWASLKGNTLVMEDLLAAGSNPNPQFEHLNHPLFYAVTADQVGSIELLARFGADLNVQNEYGLTPILLAVQRNELASIRVLIELGADLYKKDAEGNYAYREIERREVLPFVQDLLEKRLQRTS